MDPLYNLLLFRLGEQLYAVSVEPIVQIVSMVTITPIPQTSSLTEGIINVHGEAVAVVDLRRHLSKPNRQFHFHTPIILMKIKKHLVGLIVDEVDDVISLQTNQCARPCDILPDDLSNASLSLKGVTYTPDGAVLVLDPDQLFQPDQIQVLVKASDFLQEMANSGNLEKWFLQFSDEIHPLHSD